MSDQDDELGARIRRAKEAHDPTTKTDQEPAQPVVNSAGLAMRFGSELASNVIVGLVFGLLIDHFFNVRPWGTLIMLGFGLAAGILGVIRAYKQINADLAVLANPADDRD